MRTTWDHERYFYDLKENWKVLTIQKYRILVQLSRISIENHQSTKCGTLNLGCLLYLKTVCTACEQSTFKKQAINYGHIHFFFKRIWVININFTRFSSLKFKRQLTHTRCGNHFYNLRIFPNSQLISRLHGRVICHMNANFVGFQNMYNFNMSDQ